jgi:organic hydroperoxide reductase OsmC/OhrA
MTTHGYRSRVTWAGNTADGYDRYSRAHRASAPPAERAMALSADPAFLGDAGALNPEQLLLVAASSCQLLSFLARAARMRLEVTGYDDEAEAEMDMEDAPARITRIVLHPRIEVAAGTDEAKVRKAVERGHGDCFIANSLTSEMAIEPTIIARARDAPRSGVEGDRAGN